MKKKTKMYAKGGATPMRKKKPMMAKRGGSARRR